MSGRGEGGPIRIGDVLGDFLDRSGVRVQLERTGVIDEWPARVGRQLAEVTHARAVSDTTLIVEVRSSAWLMELNMMKREILSRINEGREHAPIERLVFVLGEKPTQTPDRE